MVDPGRAAGTAQRSRTLNGPFLHVVGARPNFMKVAPVHRALAARRAPQLIVHTGQHYASMSDVFFEQLGIPQPDVNLEVGSASHAVQTARTMERLEQVLVTSKPRCVVVYGDVNSTMAAALVCAKMDIPVAHVEAGLRSRDRSMPEEVNRIVTDALAAVLYTPSEDGDVNLRAEGVPSDRVVRAGNVMIDTLVRLLPAAEAEWRNNWRNRVPHRYGVVTLHRPSNVDDPAMLASMLDALVEISMEIPLVFPLHPRTMARIDAARLSASADRLKVIEPVGYVEFLALQRYATLVITDSGGIQEESTYLGVPCVTVRENTERPITVTAGTNTLVGRDARRLVEVARSIAAGDGKRGSAPPLWDGCAAERIAGDLIARFS